MVPELGISFLFTSKTHSLGKYLLFVSRLGKHKLTMRSPKHYLSYIQRVYQARLLILSVIVSSPIVYHVWKPTTKVS